MICDKCGNPMRMTDKNTFTGRDIREYECPICGHEDWEDRGIAFWKILSDAREESEATASTPSPQAEVHEIGQKPSIPRWNRLLAWLGGSRNEK